MPAKKTVKEENSQQNIEKMIEQLEDIVRKMGDTNISLDSSLELYTDGVKLAEDCLNKIENAKQIIEQHKITD